MADRRDELADTADNLLRMSRKAWNRPMLAVALGIAGSAVSLAAGNLAAAGISAVSALVGFKRQSEPGSAYSYLFRAREELSGRGSRRSESH